MQLKDPHTESSLNPMLKLANERDALSQNDVYEINLEPQLAPGCSTLSIPDLGPNLDELFTVRHGATAVIVDKSGAENLVTFHSLQCFGLFHLRYRTDY